MARPKPTIIDSVELGDGSTWEILYAATTYIVTYDGKPVSVRMLWPKLEGTMKKYRKLAYPNLASCQRQVDLLNRRFKTDRFGIFKFGA